MNNALPPSDIEDVLNACAPSRKELLAKNVFITGGTGFVGKWLTQILLSCEGFKEGAQKIGILTRDVHTSLKSCPWLAHPAIELFEGNIANFNFPPGQYDIVIHAAVPASASLIANCPMEMLETNILGTRRALAFAQNCGAGTFLLTSSGAVYGKQPPQLLRTPEDYEGSPSPVDRTSSYAEGKRCSELMAVIAAEDFGMEVKIARCFAFVAPYLPLSTHFAIGNFIKNCLEGEHILIKSDGSPLRSYMYGSDLVTWLLRILTHGKSNRPYNVGSDKEISIAELASLVHRIAGEEIPNFQQIKTEVLITGKRELAKPAERYVPSIHRATTELDLQLSVSMEESIRRTLRWHLQIGAPAS